jgi:hypothetical protein
MDGGMDGYVYRQISKQVERKGGRITARHIERIKEA